MSFDPNKLTPNPKNPRSINKEDFQKLKDKIRAFPEMLEKRPIVYKDGIVYGGNQRLEALKQLAKEGLEVKDSYFADASNWTEEQLKQFIITDNLSDGDWDWDILANEWDAKALDDWGLDLPSGFDQEAEEDDAPEVSSEPAISQSGEVYQLGRHKLMCSDSTNYEAAVQLFDGQKIEMLVTSPPYADARDYNIGSFDWDKLMNGITDTFDELSDADIIINLGQLHRDREVWFYWDNWLKYTKDKGYPLFGLYVWDKLNPIPGEYSGRLALSHEWLFHFRTDKKTSANKTVRSKHASGSGANTFRQKDGSLKKAGGKPETRDQDWKLQDSVIRVLPEKNNQTNHPAVFSVAFASELIKPWSRKGDIIYDCFAGAGTTMIACEQLDRTCYMMELDPKYCDVIRKRYAKFIGKDEQWQEATPKIS